METIEPVILAALITDEPLLLIGPHGTAKSYLLNRISIALGLRWRHYNASLLNFDDLVGYPLPNGNGGLQYVQTPSSIWDAEVVFFVVGGRVFAGCVHGEADDASKARAAMMAVLNTAQTPP